MGTDGAFLHDDHSFRRRKAWERAKRAFGECEIVEMLTRLEKCPEGCPRLLLAVCIHDFLSDTRGARLDAIDTYLQSLAFPSIETIPQEALSPEEAESLESDFRAALIKAGFVQSRSPF